MVYTNDVDQQGRLELTNDLQMNQVFNPKSGDTSKYRQKIWNRGTSEIDSVCMIHLSKKCKQIEVLMGHFWPDFLMCIIGMISLKPGRPQKVSNTLPLMIWLTLTGPFAHSNVRTACASEFCLGNKLLIIIWKELQQRRPQSLRRRGWWAWWQG